MEDRIKALEKWRYQHITNSKERLDHNQERFLALETSHTHGPSSSIPALENRIKEIEEQVKNIDARTGSNWGWIESHVKKIKDLEDWKRIHASILNHESLETKFFEVEKGIKTLEDITAKLVGQRLPDRVRDLEEWKNHYHILDPDVEDRIKTLEEWKNHMIHILPKDHGALAIRLSHLEEHEHLRNRVKALEEWKKQHLMFCNEGFGNRDHFDRRLMDLEEWKRDHFLCKEDHGPCPSDTFKTIPQEYKALSKSTWDDLKRYVSNMHYHDAVPWTYKEAFEEIIRRVEPDWNP